MARANKATKKSPAKRAHKKSSSSSSSAGGTSQERILQAIANQISFGESKPARKMIMAMAIMTNEKSFNTTILNIKKKTGFIDYDKTSIWLTDQGRDHIGSEALAVPASNDAIQEKIRTDMIKGKKPREIFDIMLDGEWHSREELASRMNVPNNKSFGTYISALSKVVERDNGTKKIRLKDMCFPFGRPSA